MITALPHAPSQGEHGFTLIEMLVSLTILGLAMLLLGHGVSQLSQGWDRQTFILEKQDVLRRGLAVVRRDLGSMIKTERTADAPTETFFAGTQQQLQFIAIGWKGLEALGVLLIRYDVERDSAGERLVRRARDYDPLTGLAGRPVGEPTTVLEGFARFHFSYSDIIGERKIWRKSWSPGKKLPVLIKLDIADDGPGIMPLAIFPIRDRAEIACLTASSTACSIAVGNSRTKPGNSEPGGSGTQK